MRYLVELTIDQRPPRKEWVNGHMLDLFKRLGWLNDGKATVLSREA